MEVFVQFAKRIYRVFLFLSISFAVSGAAFAQGYLTQIGVPAFTTALPVEQGFINLPNGNLHLQIEFGSFPERASRPLVAVLGYDSRISDNSGSVRHPPNS